MTNRQEIVKLLVKRNINHLNQAQGTPCTISPMKQLLGVDSFTEFSNDILKDVADFSNTNLTEVQKHLFTTLQRPPSQLSNVIPDFMSIAQMLNGFRKWKEQTSTSPSNRHLSHYKCLLIPEEKVYKTDKFNKMMLKIHNTILNASIYTSIPLKRWKKLDVIILPKLQNNSQINRLRVINNFEVDFNLMLKFFWPKAATHQAK